MLDNKPLVSIIIPVYNGSNFMREAIDSAISQTYSNVEIIIVNDGSNDDGATERIALSYGDRVRYIKKENGGVSSALNVGIKAMKGDYFSWLSHDDKYLPNKIQSQVDMLIHCEQKDVIMLCASEQINTKSEVIPTIKKRSLWDDSHVGKTIQWDDALINLINCGSFGGCDLLIPKAAFESAGYFDESLRYCQDFLMWIRIFLAGYSLIRTPGTQVYSRVHDGQLTQTGRAIFHSDSIKMGDMLIEPLGQKSTKTHNFLKRFALYNAKFNNPKVVKKYLCEGKRLNLLNLFDRFQIRIVLLYGKVRPFIRRLYLFVFKRVRTK